MVGDPRLDGVPARPYHDGTMQIDQILRAVESDGFVVLPAVYPPNRAGRVCAELTAALAASEGEAASVRSRAGSVYAARNVLALWPPAADVWRAPPLPEVLGALLGPGFGLVRGLFFDKPPDRGWCLPWHKDLTVAVRDHRRPGRHFGKPTVKAGVPHAEAPAALLEQMATLRVHLDDVTEENGALRVVPGSHRTGKELRLGDVPPRTVFAGRGDVLVIRPLVAHDSMPSRPGTRLHRRILHLEFAATRALPDGYEWYEFIPGDV